MEEVLVEFEVKSEILLFFTHEIEIRGMNAAQQFSVVLTTMHMVAQGLQQRANKVLTAKGGHILSLVQRQLAANES